MYDTTCLKLYIHMPSVRYSEVDEEMMSLRDWRKALRTPPTYRVGNSTLRVQTTFVTIIALLGLVILFILYTTSRRSPKFVSYSDLYRQRYIPPPLERYEKITSNVIVDEYYNATYPLTPPVTTPIGVKYRIGIISDLDTNSINKFESNTWISYLKTGFLMWHPNTHTVTIVWDRTDPIILKSTFGHSGRGMELSELVVFNGKLLSFDDRTGLIYEINLDSNTAVPWVLLIDGNGQTTKGFKSEWATVKDHRLYVGSMGKEWTTMKTNLLANSSKLLFNIIKLFNCGNEHVNFVPSAIFLINVTLLIFVMLSYQPRHFLLLQRHSWVLVVKTAAFIWILVIRLAGYLASWIVPDNDTAQNYLRNEKVKLVICTAVALIPLVISFLLYMKYKMHQRLIMEFEEFVRGLDVQGTELGQSGRIHEFSVTRRKSNKIKYPVFRSCPNISVK